MKILTYLHNCNSGDLIAALAGIREAYRKSAKKAVICQVLDLPGHYMPGLVHSVKDDKGQQVTMNQRMFDMLRPLLLSQDYIADFQVFLDQQIDIDLTIIRESVLCDEERPEKSPRLIRAKEYVGIPNMAIPGWTMLPYPQLACDISQPWIELPEGETEGIIDTSYVLVSRTERYHSPKMNYSFLNKYDDLVFTGTETEHRKFCKEFHLDFPRLEVDNFLELAYVLKKCLFFVGNQSFPWNLANAMGIPRILEMCPVAPNCQPFIGADNYGAFFTERMEYFFEYLRNKKPPKSGGLGNNVASRAMN